MLKNNEEGSTLVMVMLIVAVITILGASLFAMNMSASKQFTNKEHQVQARHLAEMGVMHYQAVVEENVREFNQEFDRRLSTNYYVDQESGFDKNRADADYLEGMCKSIKHENIETTDSITGKYEVKFIESECYDIKSDVTAKLQSKGTVTVNKTESQIEATIKISTLGSKPDEENKNPYPNPNQNKHGKHQPPEEDVEKVIGKNFIIPEGGYVPQKSNFYIEGNLDAENGKKNTNLTVENDLYIVGDIVMNNHSCIVVKGDLTVKGNIPSPLNAGIYIIVYGDAFFENAPTKINPNGGIYVKGTVTGKNLGGDLYKFRNPIDECDIIESPSNPSERSDYNWQVNPDVSPNYFPRQD